MNIMEGFQCQTKGFSFLKILRKTQCLTSTNYVSSTLHMCDMIRAVFGVINLVMFSQGGGGSAAAMAACLCLRDQKYHQQSKSRCPVFEERGLYCPLCPHWLHTRCSWSCWSCILRLQHGCLPGVCSSQGRRGLRLPHSLALRCT